MRYSWNISSKTKIKLNWATSNKLSKNALVSININLRSNRLIHSNKAIHSNKGRFPKYTIFLTSLTNFQKNAKIAKLIVKLH